MITTFDNELAIYACSMGKVFRVTHICDTDEEANIECGRNPDTGVIAIDNKGRKYLACLHGSIAPAAILNDVRSNPPPHNGSKTTQRKTMRQILKHVGRSLLIDSRWHIAVLLSCSVLFGITATLMLVKHALYWQNVKLPVEAAFAPGAVPHETATSLQTSAAWLRWHLGPEASADERLWLARFETGAAAIRAAADGPAAHLAMRETMLTLCDYQDGEARLREVADTVILRPGGPGLILAAPISATVALCAAFLLWVRVRRAEYGEY